MSNFGQFSILFIILLMGRAANAQPIGKKETTPEPGDQFYALGEKVFSNNIDSSVIHFEQALQAYEASGNKEAIIKSINTLATVNYYRNDFVQYRSYAEKSVKRAAELLGSKHVRYGESLNNLNTLFYELGDYEKSIDLLEQSLLIKEHNREPLIEIAYSYHNIGKAYHKKGEYEKALSYLQKALEFRLDTLDNSHYLIANTLFDIGKVHVDLGAKDAAYQHFTNSLDILQRLPVKNKRVIKRTIAVFQALAKLWIEKKDLKKASAFINKALALQTDKDVTNKPFSYEVLGQVSLEQQNPVAAIQAFQQAIEIAENAYKEFSKPSLARAIVKLAAVYASEGRSEQAFEQYQKALWILSPTVEQALPDSLNPTPDQLLAPILALDIMHQKAILSTQLYRQQSDQKWLALAFQNYLDAAALTRFIRQGVQTKEAKIQLSANTLPIYEGGIQTAFQLYQISKQDQYISKAFELIESNKAVLLLDVLNEQTARGGGRIPDSLLQKEKAIQLERSFYQKKILKNQADALTLKKWKDQLFQLTQEHERLTQQLENDFPVYHQIKYDNETVSISAIQKQADQTNSCLLNFFVGDSSLFVISLSGQETFFQKIDQRTAVLEQLYAFNQSLSIPASRALKQTDYPQYAQRAYQLYTTLLAPTLSQLSTSVANLAIIPDHQLNYLPFGLLIDQAIDETSSDGHFGKMPYLIRQYAIHYDYSASIHFKNQHRSFPEQQKTFLGFAPVFKTPGSDNSRSCANGDLFQLRCNQAEVSTISDLFDGDVLLGEQANKAAFETRSLNYQIIHLATHACVEEENALLSKIHFTDDYLSNIDLNTIQLQAELAVLSACNTGAGPLVRGEGVMSLARGFMIAGCMSTVMSIWAVNDCTTSEIMTSFYQYLKKGHPKNDALRKAKLDYLQQSKEEFTHPYYWGAFVQTGQPKAIDLSTTGWLSPYLLLPLLLLGSLFIALRKLRSGTKK